MEAPEAERRVEEFSVLVECQRRLIEQLERGGNDPTSAKIIFDSLQVSLSLYIHDRHWVSCCVGPEQREMRVASQFPATWSGGNCEPVQPRAPRPEWGLKPVFGIVPRVALRGGETSTKNEIKAELDKTPVVSDESVHKETSDQCGDFGFRPLTEGEKKELMDSLGPKGKKILAELNGNKSLSNTAAA